MFVPIRKWSNQISFSKTITKPNVQPNEATLSFISLAYQEQKPVTMVNNTLMLEEQAFGYGQDADLRHPSKVASPAWSSG